MKLSELKKLARQLPDFPETVDRQTLSDYISMLGLEPGELYQELEMESRYVDTHQDSSYAEPVVHLHSHAFYEMLYCRNTCGAEYLVATDRYRLRKGDIVCIPPGVSHRPLLPEGMTQPYKRDVLWVSTEMMELINRIAPPPENERRGGMLRTAGTKWEYIGELFRAGVREAEHRAPGWETVVIGNTVALVGHLRRAFADEREQPAAAEKPELLDRALAYIERNLSRKITLADTARQLYVSESTVSQLFRQKMGVSFYRCVTQRRLIAAKELIISGILLEEVGQRVGFSDYSTFYRAFKQEYGVSPRQFRKLQEPNR